MLLIIFHNHAHHNRILREKKDKLSIYVNFLIPVLDRDNLKIIPGWDPGRDKVIWDRDGMRSTFINIPVRDLVRDEVIRDRYGMGYNCKLCSGTGTERYS